MLFSLTQHVNLVETGFQKNRLHSRVIGTNTDVFFIPGKLERDTLNYLYSVVTGSIDMFGV